MNTNKLCPKGWAWCVGDCDFGQDCDHCTREKAPMMKAKEEASR